MLYFETNDTFKSININFTRLILTSSGITVKISNRIQITLSGSTLGKCWGWKLDTNSSNAFGQCTGTVWIIYADNYTEIRKLMCDQLHNYRKRIFYYYLLLQDKKKVIEKDRKWSKIAKIYIQYVHNIGWDCWSRCLCP